MTFKHYTILLLALLFFTAVNAQEKEKFSTTLLKKAHVNYSLNSTSNYKYQNLGIGLGYGKSFQAEPALSWEILATYNWGKYTFFDTEAYQLISREAELKTRSLSFPITLGYNIYSSTELRVNLFTGPVYEILLSAESRDIVKSDLRTGQVQWTLGSELQLWNLCSARVAFIYSPTTFFRNGDLNRSSVQFSILF